MTTPLAWVAAIHRHELALDGTTLRCRKTDGQVLESIPRAVRASPVGEQFAALQEWLVRHEKECRATVESWLLGGAPVPARLLARVWPDPGWRACLEHLLVDVGGEVGLLADMTGEGRTCLRRAGGTCQEPPVGPVTLVHPVLLDEVGPWRQALEERHVVQGIEQLGRQVYRQPEGTDPAATGLDDHPGEHFRKLWRARLNALENGIVIQGGFAVLGIVERGVRVQVRCWVDGAGSGSDDGAGRLLWVDEDERAVPLGEVGPVTWSEGLRMAGLIYGEPKTDDE
ncbi:DUF4132 domain-containing protein [Streptomyces sp. NPDC048483]|uniref:DUF4132 domain-containing protein n=1 Tax=Streptomyces sp. NPDC048483 TaxID=3154927 RepID=UPI0034378AAF